MIPTAEEFLKSEGCNYTSQKEKLYFSDVTKEDLIEFAKLHVEAALKEASEQAEIENDWDNQKGNISKDSILNAYPLENIK